MRICLIHVKENWTPVPPFGILQIGTLLRDNAHSVMVLDININEKEKYLTKIQKFHPDIVGFSVMTTSYAITKEFNEYLIPHLNHPMYCWGGVHPTALPKETLKDNPHLNFIVVGEGEETFKEIANLYDDDKLILEKVNGIAFMRHGAYIQNPPRQLIQDLDSLPFADRNLLENFRWYLSPPGILRSRFYYGITTMYSSRGCYFNCIFCSSKIVHGRCIRQRSANNVIGEMNYLKKECDIKGVYFNDDTFATSKKWLQEFCDEVKKFGMVWGCQTRANIAQNYDILKMMKDAGCVQVDIGAESGSQKILNVLKKGITVEQIKKSFENLKKLRMTTFATFILGNPGETMEDIKMTEEIAKLAPGGVSFLILVPYPGCELYKMAKENKWFRDKEIIFDERFTNKQADNPLMDACEISPEELVKIRAKLQNKFFWKNNLITFIAFLKSPKFLFQALKTIFGHPVFIIKSLIKAIRKRKSMDFLEDVYQKFNADMRN